MSIMDILMEHPTISIDSFEDALLPSQDIGDFSATCRICATSTHQVWPIFEGECQRNNLASIIQTYLPQIKLSKSDLLPLVICEGCMRCIVAWHSLVRRSARADRALRARLEQAAAPIPTTTPTPITVVTLDPAFKTATYQLTPVCNNENFAAAVDLGANDLQVLQRAVHENTTSNENQSGARAPFRTCPVCARSVSRKSWRRHERAHAGERRHRCARCGRAFAEAGNLRRHAAAHAAAARAHACGACGRAFRRREHLAEHARTHAARRDFVCHVCGAASRSPAALRMHLRTHRARPGTGDRPLPDAPFPAPTPV